MSELVFPAPQYERLTAVLLAEEVERAAILFAHVVEREDHGPRFLVVDAEVPGEAGYVGRGAMHAVLEPSTVLRAVRRAQRESLALVFAHSHPLTEHAMFSAVDDDGEAQLAPFVEGMCPGRPHATLVVARRSCAARVIGTNRSLHVLEIGRARVIRSAERGSVASEVDDRQVRALGASGQAILRDLRVAVVGVGGTGSLVAQQLAHLGVGEITLVDPDTVEATNLNRVVGAMWNDVGGAKVDVLSRTLSRVRPGILVRPLPASVLEARYARTVAESDFVFCCTDTHGSRAVLGQLAYQYLVPTIDLGLVIRTDGGTVTHIAGRAHYLAPGLGCLVCAGILDPAQVRRDLMSDEERDGDPYFVGHGEPQPAVIAFNSLVAGAAVAMFLRVVTGIGTNAALVNYDGLRGTIRPAEPRRDAYCIVCSEEGALARGDSIPLPARPS